MTALGGPTTNARATLRVGGATVDPGEVTGAVGVEPSYAHAKGDVISPRVTSRRKEGMWMLDSRADATAPLEEHIQGLLDRLPAPAAWRAATQGASVDMYCSIRLARECEGFSLSAALMQRLAEFGIELGFEIWDVSSGEDEDTERNHLAPA